VLTVVAASYVGWWIGLSVGFLVVVVAVAVVGTILGVASRLSDQAAILGGAVEDAGASTLELPRLEDASETLADIVVTVRRARSRLGG